MKRIVSAVVLIAFLAPAAFAASDCAHTCCRTYSGAWDDDFDNCRHPKDGYDQCKSDCEARAIANSGLVHPDTTNAEHYSCSVGLVLLALAGVAICRAYE